MTPLAAGRRLANTVKVSSNPVKVTLRDASVGSR
jgi:hypothetical protein